MSLSLALPDIPVAFGASQAGQEMPSGLPAELIEVLIDQIGAEIWLRFRFLSPAVGTAGDDYSFDIAQTDLEFLCRDIAEPYMRAHAIESDFVAISLLDRRFDFGQPAPEATQLIEIFRVSGGECSWGYDE